MTRLDEIAARLEAATPGPWEAYGTTVAAMTGPGECGGCSGLPSPAHEPACLWSEVAGAGELDADLIAHAPADLAALLAVVREVAKVSVPVGVTPSDDPWWKGHEEAMRRVRVQLAPLTETTEETNNAG